MCTGYRPMWAYLKYVEEAGGSTRSSISPYAAAVDSKCQQTQGKRNLNPRRFTLCSSRSPRLSVLIRRLLRTIRSSRELEVRSMVVFYDAFCKCGDGYAASTHGYVGPDSKPMPARPPPASPWQSYFHLSLSRSTPLRTPVPTRAGPPGVTTKTWRLPPPR